MVHKHYYSNIKSIRLVRDDPGLLQRKWPSCLKSWSKGRIRIGIDDDNDGDDTNVDGDDDGDDDMSSL